MTTTAPTAPASQSSSILSDVELFANIALSLAHNTVLVQDIKLFLAAIEPGLGALIK